MEHEVTSTYVLHHKEQMVPCLEAGVEASEEWWLVLQSQNSTLVEGTLHIILLYNDILLQTLNSIYFLGRLVLSKEDLSKASFA